MSTTMVPLTGHCITDERKMVKALADIVIMRTHNSADRDMYFTDMRALNDERTFLSTNTLSEAFAYWERRATATPIGAVWEIDQSDYFTVTY